MPVKNQIAFDVAQIVEAITDTRGNRSEAARRLGVSVRTMRKYCKDIPEVAEALQDATEKLLDKVDAGLEAFATGYISEPVIGKDGRFERGPEGEIVMQRRRVRDSDRLGAMKFIASTRGKDRGYSRHVTVAGDKDAPLKLDTSGMTASEKVRFAGMLSVAAEGQGDAKPAA